MGDVDIVRPATPRVYRSIASGNDASEPRTVHLLASGENAKKTSHSTSRLRGVRRARLGESNWDLFLLGRVLNRVQVPSILTKYQGSLGSPDKASDLRLRGVLEIFGSLRWVCDSSGRCGKEGEISLSRRNPARQDATLLRRFNGKRRHYKAINRRTESDRLLRSARGRLLRANARIDALYLNTQNINGFARSLTLCKKVSFHRRDHQHHRCSERSPFERFPRTVPSFLFFVYTSFVLALYR